MKKIFIIILRIIQLLLLIGMQIIHYFTRTKMGMARYMVYFGKKVEAYKLFSFPIVNILYIILLILAIFSFIISYKFAKYEALVLLLYSIGACIVIFLSLSRGARDYYANIIVQSLLIFIQEIIILCLLERKK